MVGVFDEGWETACNGLKVLVYIGRDSFCRCLVTSHKGAARMFGFVDFGKKVEGEGAGYQWG